MRSWIQCFLQQQHQKPKQTEPMKSTIKAKTIAPKQKASISSKGGRIKATKPAKPAALDKTITIARVNATAAVNNGQVAATTSRTPITWNSIDDLDPTRVLDMKLDELKADINDLSHLVLEAIHGVAAYGKGYFQARRILGVYLCALKKFVGHGKFGECLRTDFPGISDRSAQRCMRDAKTRDLSDLKPRPSGKYDPLQMKEIIEMILADETPSAPKRQVAPELTPARVASRLKSLREFLENAVDALPVDKFDPSTRDHLLKEFAAIGELFQKVSAKLTELAEPKLVQGVVIPVDSNGVALHSA